MSTNRNLVIGLIAGLIVLVIIIILVIVLVSNKSTPAPVITTNPGTTTTTPAPTRATTPAPTPAPTTAAPTTPPSVIASSAGYFTGRWLAGSCRGPGWDQNGWPRAQGRLTQTACQDRCISNDCTAYDLARPQDNTYDCWLFGHTNVIGDGGGDKCYVRT